MRHFGIIAGALSIALCIFSACGNKYEFNLDERIGLCGGVGKDSIMVANGLAYIEASVSGFLDPEASEEEFEANRKYAAEAKLPILAANGFFPREIKVVGPDADLDRAVKYSETAIRRASEIGIKTLVLGSSRSRNVPEGFDHEEGRAQFVNLLKAIAPYAEKSGITIVIEPLQQEESNLINTVREGTAICKEVNSPAICVLADFFHMARMKEDAGAIVEAGKYLKHCHIAECESRTAPGVKGDDFTPYFQALKDIKYEGLISFECGWQNNQEELLPAAMKVMKEQIAAVK